MSAELDNLFKQVRVMYDDKLKPSEIVELGVMITASGIFRTAEQCGTVRAVDTCKVLTSMYRDTWIKLARAGADTVKKS